MFRKHQTARSNSNRNQLESTWHLNRLFRSFVPKIARQPWWIRCWRKEFKDTKHISKGPWVWSPKHAVENKPVRLRRKGRRRFPVQPMRREYYDLAWLLLCSIQPRHGNKHQVKHVRKIWQVEPHVAELATRMKVRKSSFQDFLVISRPHTPDSYLQVSNFNDPTSPDTRP